DACFKIGCSVPQRNPSALPGFSQKQVCLSCRYQEVGSGQLAHATAIRLREIVEACKTQGGRNGWYRAVVVSHRTAHLVVGVIGCSVDRLLGTRLGANIADGDRRKTRVVVALEVIDERFGEVEVRTFGTV